MAEGKWIDGLHADMPLVEAARQVLAARLGAVRERLPPALHQADEDLEHVHQLRVSTRRAGAALDIFELCLPGKAYKKMKKSLRRLRRAAGAARDWDVFIAELEARAAKCKVGQRPGLDFLLGYGHAQRVAAQAPLLEATQSQPLLLDTLIEQTQAALRPPSTSTAPHAFREHAVAWLTALLGELNHEAQQDLKDYEHLHQVRIIGKRLRYAMEVFLACFGPALAETLYPAIEKMQEILGQANDSNVACQRLQDIRKRLASGSAKTWKRLQSGILGLLKHHRRRLPEQGRLFEKWWKRWEGLNPQDALEVL